MSIRLIVFIVLQLPNLVPKQVSLLASRAAAIALFVATLLLAGNVEAWPQEPPTSGAEAANPVAPAAESESADNEGENSGAGAAAENNANISSKASDSSEANDNTAGPLGDANREPNEDDKEAGDNSGNVEDSGDQAERGSSESPESTSSQLPSDGNVPIGGQNLGLNSLRTNILLGVVLAILAVSYVVGFYLTKQSSEKVNAALIRRFRQRVNAWLMMCAMLVFGLLLGSTGIVVIFGLISFWALREFITMAPTRRGDHRALFWALIVFTPLQYLLVAFEASNFTFWRTGKPIDYYGLYSIMIPVYASLYIPARIAIAGDHKKFLERSAQITFGLLICVYSLSYAPALVNLSLSYSSGGPFRGSTAGLLFYLILVSQLSDILQWTWGQLAGKRTIAAEVSSGRTWEGFAGGTLSTGLVGAALFWVTPFTFWESACMAMVISAMGMFGGMAMSAIKRDRGVNDYGSLVLGHAGILDRIDTLCFAAPVFYHLTRFFYS